jgi:hypothetical protein
MNKEIQYCVDSNGNKISVIVPFKDWETITKQNAKLHAKLNFISGVKSAMNEVQEAKKSGKKLPTLKEFINENS